MKNKALAFAFALLAVVLAPTRAHAEAEVSFQFFYDSLSPHGEWIEVGDYGECWQPSGVDAEWSPYTDGYWSYTDAGWTWVSYEDFGGITYHYGRWVRAEEVGWCWVPDTEWGPAWVSWRNSDEHIGWAPLPPEAKFTASVGISTWVDDSYDIGPGYYNFCPIVEFGAPLIRTVCVPRFEVIRIYGGCVNVTNISYNSYSNVVFCGGPSFAFINARCHRPVPALKLVQNFNITNININKFNGWNQGNTLQVYAPKIVKNKTVIINKPKITKVVMKDKVNRGWNDVKDPEEKLRLRAKVKQESKGLTAETAPARPVKKDDFKAVPVKADLKAPSPIAKGPGRRDTDGDGIANRNDKDKDADGVKDAPGRGKVAGEGGGKGLGRADGEKMPGKVGVDDGAPAKPVGRNDTDGDGIPNRSDKDKDGDGVKDSAGKVGREPGTATVPKTNGNGEGKPAGKVRRDDDGDGISNRFDKDKAGDGVQERLPGQGGLRKTPGVVNDPDAGDRLPNTNKPAKGLSRGGFQQPGNGNGSPGPDRPNLERKRDLGQNNAQMDAEKQARQAAKQQQLLQQQQQLRQNQMQQRQAEKFQAEKQARQAQRQQQMPPQIQRTPNQQMVPGQGGGGGGGGQGKGKKNLTPEEIEALKKQRGR